jgi:spore maturation protein CgeB
MRFVFFIQSLISDWNHGNAHFLRGIITELILRGHHVTVFEPESSWTLNKLVQHQGENQIRSFYDTFPHLRSIRYTMNTIDLDVELDMANVVIVHEWNTHELVNMVGKHRKHNNHYRLFFHDTHHRSVTDPVTMSAYDLSHYDGVLAFGESVRFIYLQNSWIQNAWVWHEAADTQVFRPLPLSSYQGDIVWIGNWGDDERCQELYSFLFQPVQILNVQCRIYGVRYPLAVRQSLKQFGIDYYGWIPNYKVPLVFSQFKMTVHIPRRPYVDHLCGIPTIRPFEALACGIPLVCTNWEDCENLFTYNKDFLVANTPREMKQHITMLLNDPVVARQLSDHGLKTILSRHTCKHRVDELLTICESTGAFPVSTCVHAQS